MIIKLPVAYDTSYWEEIPDFALVSPRPLLVCTKATEGTTIKDPKFIRYWGDLKQDGILRSAYHFYRKAYTPAQNASNYLSVISANGVAVNDILELDLEEEGISAAQIIVWLDIVEARYPKNMIIIYSRANLLNPISMTAAEKTRLQKYWLWMAGYPLNPDGFLEIPADYVPDQSKWGKVAMWQYSDKAVVMGIIGNADVNWLAPFFVTWLNSLIPVPALDVTPVLHKLDLFEAVLQSDMAERLAEWSSLMDEIKADISALKGSQPPPQPEPEPDPIPEEPPSTDPVYPGYTGTTVGVYRVRQTIEKDPANGSEYVNARGAKLRTAPDFAAGEAQFALRDEQERFLLALNGGNLQPLYDRGFLKDGNQFKQLFQFAFPGQMLVVLDKKKVGELVWGKILVISKDSMRGDNRYPLDAKWTNEQRTNWLVHVRIQNEKTMVIPFFDPKEAHGDLSFLWIPMGALEKV